MQPTSEKIDRPDESHSKGYYLCYMLKKAAFGLLARINKVVLPRVSKFNLDRLTKTQKALVAYKYWVVLHVLE